MALLKMKSSRSSEVRMEKMRDKIVNPKSMRSLNLNIDGALLKKFKIKVASEDITMTEVITRAIENYLK